MTTLCTILSESGLTFLGSHFYPQVTNPWAWIQVQVGLVLEPNHISHHKPLRWFVFYSQNDTQSLGPCWGLVWADLLIFFPHGLLADLLPPQDSQGTYPDAPQKNKSNRNSNQSTIQSETQSITNLLRCNGDKVNNSSTLTI